MDSFYDHPRPNVFVNKNLHKELNMPIFPEVTKASLLINDSAKDSIYQNSNKVLTGRLTSYNIWRKQNEQKFLQKPLSTDSNVGNNVTDNRTINTNTVLASGNNNEPFGKLYLSNLPKRQSDRSLKESELCLSENANSISARQKNDSLNESAVPNPPHSNSLHLQKILDKLDALNTSQEQHLPTIQELFKVIEKKDEQMRSLENQVETLLKINTSFVNLQEQHMITIRNQNKLLKTYSKSLMKNPKKSGDNCANQKLERRNCLIPKIKLQKNGTRQDKDHDNEDDDDAKDWKNSSENEFLSSSSSLSSSSTASSESSVLLPQLSSDQNRFRNFSDQETRLNSVHFTMDTNSHAPLDEYQSDEECTNYRNSKHNDVGFTFYDNIMGQVNKFLENTTNNGISSKKRTTPVGRSNDLKNKKKTTKTQRKSSSNDENVRNNNKNDNQKNDVSAVVRKVLVQYLPHLKHRESNRMLKTNEPAVAAAVEPSFTTLQYQEKYCLFQSQFQSPDNPNYFTNSKAAKHRYYRIS